MSTSYLVIGDDLIKDSLLQSVRVVQELNQHSWCYVICRTTGDEPFPLAEILGKDIRIDASNEEGEVTSVFRGFVLDGEVEYETSGSLTAWLTGVSFSYKLEVTPQHRYFLAKTLPDIANALTAEDGLEAKVQCSDKRPLNYVQYEETDFDFLRRLADDHGAWLRPTDAGIEISNAFADGQTIEWRKEFGLISFKAKGTLRQPSFDGCHYNHHEMKSKEYRKIAEDPECFESLADLVEATQKASRERIPSGYVGARSRVVTHDDYEKLLKKESVRSLGAAVSGTGISRNAWLKPGDTVEITGPVAAQGTYGLVKLTHLWEPKGYINEFECTPWKHYTSREAPKMKSKLGLVPARVVHHDDPKKMGRIRVRYFWQDDEAGHWARFLTPHAGGGRGFMFMPEVGDEVVVAFEDGDPERPYILGCVWNGVDTAPRQKFYGDDIAPNHVKRIVTKSGNRIQMVDVPGHEAIVLTTPNSAKITLIENAAETGRTMLSLHSTGDILLSAPDGRVHIKSKFFSRDVG